MIAIILALSLGQAHNLNNARSGNVVIAPDSPLLGVFGAQKVTQETPLESLTFQYGINSEFVLQTVSDGGTITQANSSAIMSTGTASDGGYALLRSRRLTRYVPGQGVRVRFTTVFTACKALSTQEVGFGSEIDFIGVGCIGADFGVIHRVGGVTTFVKQSQWNGTPVTFNVTKGNVWSLAYQWLGYGVMRIQYEKPDGTFVTVHTFQFPNSRTTPTFSNPALRFRARAFNWGNTTNMVLAVPSVGLVVEGPIPNGGVRHGALNRRVITTALQSIISIRNNATWGDAGVENRGRIHMHDVHVSGSGAGDINCLMVQNPAITGASFVNIDIDTSFAAVDIAGTTIDGGTLRHGWVFEGAAGGSQFDLQDTYIEPGDVITVACYAVTGNSNTGAAINWSEEF